VKGSQHINEFWREDLAKIGLEMLREMADVDVGLFDLVACLATTQGDPANGIGVDNASEWIVLPKEVSRLTLQIRPIWSRYFAFNKFPRPTFSSSLCLA
jgi:hypothetical protein